MEYEFEVAGVTYKGSQEIDTVPPELTDQPYIDNDTILREMITAKKEKHRPWDTLPQPCSVCVYYDAQNIYNNSLTKPSSLLILGFIAAAALSLVGVYCLVRSLLSDRKGKAKAKE